MLAESLSTAGAYGIVIVENINANGNAIVTKVFFIFISSFQLYYYYVIHCCGV